MSAALLLRLSVEDFLYQEAALLDDEEARLGVAGSAPPLIPNTE